MTKQLCTVSDCQNERLKLSDFCGKHSVEYGEEWPPQTPAPLTSNQMSPDRRATHIRWLSIMLDYYGGEETALRARLDKREVWGDGHENEWRRYQAEAAALRAAIEALSGDSSAPETTPDDLLWDTIAQNTRLATALKHVTESWVNGRRVLDGIGERAAKLACEAFELLPEQTTNDDIQVGGVSFRRGVKLSIVLARIIRGTPSTLTDRPSAEETTEHSEKELVSDIPYHTVPQDIIDKVVEVRRWFDDRNVKRWSVAGIGPLHVETKPNEVELFDGESHIHRLPAKTPAKPCPSCFGDKAICMSNGEKRQCELCGGTGINPIAQVSV